MCIYIYICKYIYKYIYIYTSMFIYMHTYIYRYTYMNAYIYKCMHMYKLHIVIVQNNLQLYKTPAKDTPSISRHGVATISRLLQIIGLFCRT